MRKSNDGSPTVIGIHYGHNATVAGLEHNEVVTCMSEERFNRIKNSTGFPILALEYVRKQLSKPADLYVFTQRYSWGYRFLKKQGFRSSAFNHSYANNPPRPTWAYQIFPEYLEKRDLQRMLAANEIEEANDAERREMIARLAAMLDEPEEKIRLLDHHESHAYSTPLFSSDPSKDMIIFTLDGEGDGLCASVSIWRNGRMERISSTNRSFSLGYLYREVTAYLGMKPDEHEFKVMGLAPYGKEEHIAPIVDVFKAILWLGEDGNFHSSTPIPAYAKFVLQQKLAYRRFDSVAAAIQKFTEDIVTDWVTYWVKKTGISHIGLAGGVFMNVKMNQKLSELDIVDSVTITPSAGDESTVLGALWWGGDQLSCGKAIPQTLNHLYLGTSYSYEEIESFLQESGCFEEYAVTKPEDIADVIAELLARNQIVARFDGRMEFGARALGNRSILANPSSFENVRVINEMIKNRDFWMPFAASILQDDAARYLRGERKVNGAFMAVTFDTTELAHQHIQAALHPYDKTCRPQIVDERTNKNYYRIINAFKKLTGIGAVLNTSFNLHGEPNVEKPADAIHTLENSGLRYLAMGPFLIEKK